MPPHARVDAVGAHQQVAIVAIPAAKEERHSIGSSFIALKFTAPSYRPWLEGIDQELAQLLPRDVDVAIVGYFLLLWNLV